MDCLGRRSAFLSHDFGLPRRGSFSAVPFGSLDSLHSSSGISSSSAWALGLISNGPESPNPLAPQFVLQKIFVAINLKYFNENFDVIIYLLLQ